MQLSSFLDGEGSVRVGVLVDGVLRDVTAAAGADGDGAGAGAGAARGAASSVSPLRRLLIDGLDVERLAAAASTAPKAEIASVLPVVPDPTKIVAAPVNYRDHQDEMAQAAAIESMGVFLKAPSSLIGDGQVVRLPYHDRRFDQEGELGVVIGRTASHVPRQHALDHVAGYMCLLDMTMRGGEDRSVRKSFDTFTPTGPHLVTPDEVGPLDRLELHTWVGGTLRQRADISDLIWDVAHLIEYISSVMVLHPGDVIASGTPAGVGPVSDGERVEVEITHLGRLGVTVSSSGAVACPTLGRDSGPPPPTTLTPPRERHGA